MALKSIIYKVKLQLADMDKHVYTDLNLQLALHPSETHIRLLARILAFAINTREELAFTRGLCVADEPAIWAKELTGEISLWIELGSPSLDKLKKASHGSKEVIVYGYGNDSQIWFEKNKNKIAKYSNVSVYQFPQEDMQIISNDIDRQWNVSLTISEGECLVTTDNLSRSIELTKCEV